MAAGALLLWVFQAGVAEYILKRRGGDIFQVERVEGSLTSGFRLYGIRAKTAAFSAYIRRVDIYPDLNGLLRGVIAVNELIIRGAVIKPVPAHAVPAAKKNAYGPPAWLEIKTIRLKESSVEFPSEAGAANAVTGIVGELSLKRSLININTLRGEFQGFTAALSGKYEKSGLIASGDISSRLPDLLLHFDFALTESAGYDIKARGHLNDALIRLDASLDHKGGWMLDLGASGLPLSAARADLPDLAGAAALNASGRYFSAGKMIGSARFNATLLAGAALNGKINFSPDLIRLNAALGSPEAKGALSVEDAAGALKGSWELNSTKELSLPLKTTLRLGSFKAKGTIGGRIHASAFSWDVRVSTAVYGPLKADILLADGEFRTAADPWFKMAVEVKNVSSGAKVLGSASLKMEGTAAANTLNLWVSSA